MAKILKVRLF